MGKRKPTRRIRAASDTPAEVGTDAFGDFVTVAAVGLLTVRWLIPTEAASAGGTLWIATAWILLAAFAIAISVRRSQAAFRWHLFDAAVLVLVAGFAVSALRTILSGGDVRSAINMLWEWIAVGVSVPILRNILSSAEARQVCRKHLLAAGCMLSLLGIWQHEVRYETMSADYREQREQLDELLNTNPGDPEVRRIQQSFFEAGVPLDGPGRVLFEQRLFASREPFGRFALANTLAGLLAVVVVLGIGMGLGSASSLFSVDRSRIVIGGLLLPVMICLLFTKSRTAWLATIVGLIALGVCLRRLRPPVTTDDTPDGRLSKRGRVAMLAVLTFVFAAGAFAAWRSLDRFVLSEAPKSLTYRLEYWTGTWAVIQEYPLFGIGPGNFRQHYLAHKLPQSSEEILDPHNLFLEAWSTGGLIALLGLLGVIGLPWWSQFLTRNSQHIASPPRTIPEQSPARLWLIGGALGFVMLFLSQGWMLTVWEIELIVLGLIWGTSLLLLLRFAPSSQVPAGLDLCGMLTLVVHLSASGGMGMPAVVQLLLLLGVLVTSASRDSASDPTAISAGRHPSDTKVAGPFSPYETVTNMRQPWMIGGLTVTLLFAFGVLWTGLAPVLSRNLHISLGDRAWQEQGDWQRAKSSYLLAATIDPHSAEPWTRLVGTAQQRWQRSVPDAAEITQTLAWADETIARDPYAYSGYVRRAETAWDVAEITGENTWRTRALADFAQAVRRYPTYSRLRADYALAAHTAEDVRTAAEQAQTALDLDRTNRELGHVDRYLDDETVAKLQTIVETAGI